MMAWVLTAWRIATSRTGLIILAAVAVLALAMILLHHQYAKGVAAGRAEMAPTIKTLTDNLTQCHANQATLEGAIKQQSDAIATNSAEATARLEAQAKVLAASQSAARAAQARVDALSKPLAGIDTCARLLELDGRLVAGMSK